MSRDDLERELLRILSQITIKKNYQSVSKKFDILSFINSSFFITIIGGLIIGVITMQIQDNISDANRKLQENRETYMLKYKLLCEFSDGMIACLVQSYGMQRRHLWLNKVIKKNKQTVAMYNDGRSFVETRDFWELQRVRFNRLKHPDSLCAQVRAMYNSPDLLKKIDKLDKVMDEYFETNDETTLKKCFNDANQMYQDVITLIGIELSNDRGN